MKKQPIVVTHKVCSTTSEMPYKIIIVYIIIMCVNMRMYM